MTDKKYRIKEIFYSIQGEGYYAGKPAIFIRFSGCNLWNGKEKDRDKAICKFCDTDFIGTNGQNGGVYTTNQLLNKILDISFETNCSFLVFTGGEPLLQFDKDLLKSLKANGLYIALETNGTLKAIDGIDWLTVSPKYGADTKQMSGNEIKIVYPQDNLDPAEYLELDFTHFYLQPKDDFNQRENIAKALEYCLAHPEWKLSLQLHKILGID